MLHARRSIKRNRLIFVGPNLAKAVRPSFSRPLFREIVPAGCVCVRERESKRRRRRRVVSKAISTRKRSRPHPTTRKELKYRPDFHPISLSLSPILISTGIPIPCRGTRPPVPVFSNKKCMRSKRLKVPFGLFFYGSDEGLIPSTVTCVSIHLSRAELEPQE